MRKLFYAVFLIAGMSFASVNLSSAQDTKAKAACCTKDKATAGKCAKACTTADGKICTGKSGACTMKAGAVAGKETSKTKTGPVAEAKTK